MHVRARKPCMLALLWRNGISSTHASTPYLAPYLHFRFTKSASLILSTSCKRADGRSDIMVARGGFGQGRTLPLCWAKGACVAREAAFGTRATPALRRLLPVKRTCRGAALLPLRLRTSGQAERVHAIQAQAFFSAAAARLCTYTPTYTHPALLHTWFCEPPCPHTLTPTPPTPPSRAVLTCLRCPACTCAAASRC